MLLFSGGGGLEAGLPVRSSDGSVFLDVYFKYVKKTFFFLSSCLFSLFANMVYFVYV